MPYSIRSGVRIYYEVIGTGPPLLMLHANPCDHRMWMYQISHFSRYFKVIATDMRGYGRSDKPQKQYPFCDLIRDIIGVCQQENVSRGILMGASMGSKIGFQVGIEHPNLFQAQIHVGGNSFRGSSYDARIIGYEKEHLPSYRKMHLKELFAPGFVDTKRGRYLSKVILEDSGLLSGKAISSLFHTFDKIELSREVSQIKVPVLIVNGEYDNSLEGGKETANLIKSSKHETILGTGHLCNLEDPSAFDLIVEGFLHDHNLFPPL
ncbi:MAG: alpha/beta hydrolase [Pseudomonadota bacterium]|nr:alpha/beta hydrolase [Pseudomonadota bacterium]